MSDLIRFTAEGHPVVAHHAESAELARSMAEHGAALLIPQESVANAIGTSTLGGVYVAENAAQFRHVIRLRADSEFHWQSDLTRACAQLGLPERSVSRPESPLLGLRHWMHTASDRMLLWLDDVVDEDFIQPLVEAWDELRRGGSACRLMITGSEPGLRVRTVPDPIVLRGLPAADALQWLLHNWQTEKVSQSEIEAAGVLCECLANHPAAIRLIAKSARHASRSLSEVLESVQTRLRHSQTEMPAPMELAVSVVVKQLQTTQLSAVQLLGAACCLDQEAILSAQTQQHSRDHVGAQWRILEESGILTGNGQETGFGANSVRRLVWNALPEEVRRNAINSLSDAGNQQLRQVSGDTEPWTERSIRLLQDVWPLIDLATQTSRRPESVTSLLESAVDLLDRMGACETAVTIINRLMDHLPSESNVASSNVAARLLERRGNIRLKQQRFLQARKDLRSCYQLLHASKTAESDDGLRVSLSIVETDLNECRLQRAATRLVAAADYVRTHATQPDDQMKFFMLRGALHLQAGRAATAEPFLTKSLHLAGALPHQSGSEQRVRVLLARTCYAMGRMRDAERLLRQAIELRREQEGTGRLDVIVPQLLLADLLLVEGRFAEAEILYREVYEIRRFCLGGRHRLTGETANRLAVALAQRGDFRGAEPLFLGAIAICEDVYGAEHLEVAQALNDYAEALFVQGKYGSVRQLLERALNIQEASLRKTDHRIARTRNNLAALYSAQGELERAADLYTRDLQVKRQSHPTNNAVIANALNNLGTVCLSQARFDAANTYLTEALQLRRAYWSQHHPSVAQSLNNLGCLRLQQRQYDDALTLLREALQIREAVLAPRHPHIAATCEALGETLLRHGQNEEALVMLQRALAISEEVFGDRHQRSAHIMAQLGRTELRLSKRARAELHLRKAEQTLQQTIGVRHRWYGTVLLGLAEQHTINGRHDEAHPLLEQALAVFRACPGCDLAVSDVLHALGENFLARKAFQEARTWLEESLNLRLHWLKADHLETLQTKLRLATAMLALKDVDLAEHLFQHAMDVCRSLGEVAKSSYADAVTGMADVSVARSKLTEAEVLLQERLDLNSAGGASPQSRVMLLSRIAGVRYLREDYASAVPLIQECIQLIEHSKGLKHPDLIAHYDNLAGVYFRLGRYAEAESLVQRALGILEHEFAEDHPSVIELLENYASILETCNRNSEAQQIQNRLANLRRRNPHVLDEIM